MADINRRALFGAAAASAAAGSARAAITGLRAIALKADGLTQPMGLEAAPRLSWQIVGDGDNRRQSACRIGAASSQAYARARHFDLWDSGPIASSATLDIAYGGPALHSGQRVFWAVQISDEAGKASPWSAVSWWEMGLLDAGDWKATWIEAEDDRVRAERAEGVGWIWGADAAHKETRKFRWRFHLDADVPGAALAIAAKDELRGLWLDGQPVMPPKVGWGMGPELPLPLRRGEHVLAVEVGLRLDEARPVIGGALAVVLRLRGDGPEKRLRSGPDWRTTLVAADGWQAPGFDDSAWPTAQAAAVTPPCFPWPSAPPVRLRREFVVTKFIVQARLRATALGAYEFSLNGKRVGDAVLTPESTDFRTLALYKTYDVTGLLKGGSNAMGATVADGWFASPFSFLDLRYAFGPPPRRLLAQLELTYADGSRETIATDDQWRLGPSPVLRSEIYDGESHDARRDAPGWDLTGFDASQWSRAQIGKSPGYAPVSQVSPSIRRMQTLPPVSITSLTAGVHVFDFGQNFAGWCRLSVKGPAGTLVRLRFAEALDGKGNLDITSNRRAAATDTYVLSGDPAGEVWEPRFTYHGFRYVEVTGLPGGAMHDTLQGIVLHSHLAFTGKITTDNPVLHSLWQNTFWSQRSNFTGVPTDCPQRDERMGWTGDAEIFWDAAAFNMDVDAFTRRYAGDLRAGQLPGGEGADVAPYWALGQNTPGWSDALIVLPWTTWQRYGDTAIINDNWTAMVRFNAHLESINPDFIWRNQRGLDYGDWLSVDAKSRSDITTPKELVSTAMWARSTAMLAAMAKATGRASEAGRLEALRDRIVAAFRHEFVRPDGGVGNDSQTSHILALHFGLLPDSLKPASVAKLAADIRRRDTHLSTGFIGTPFILDALADNGEEALAVDLLLQTTPPSWGSMALNGTSLWERWDGVKDGKVTGSLNHYAFGAIMGFVYRRLGGIDCAEPGFRSLNIRPIFSSRLNGFGAEYHAATGRIATQWQRKAGKTVFQLTVPANVSAKVQLPGRSIGVGSGVHRFTF